MVGSVLAYVKGRFFKSVCPTLVHSRQVLHVHWPHPTKTVETCSEIQDTSRNFPPLLGPPAVLFHFFWLAGFPLLKYRTKGALILASLLEDLVKTRIED